MPSGHRAVRRDSNLRVPESTRSGSVGRTAPSHMSVCGWGSGGSVGRTFPTQKIAALRAAEGRSVGLLRLKFSSRCARPGGRSVGSNDKYRVTVSRPRRRLRWSAHGSGDCPTTAWYRVSSGMLKLPPVARTDACRVSDANSSCTLAAAAGNARGSAVTVTTSAEVVGSSIGRLSHHRMTPCELWDAQTPACCPHRLVRRFRCVLRESARRGSRERSR